MRISQPITYPPERLWTARTLARLLEGQAPALGEEDAVTQRVEALRREVESGIYRVDPDALATVMLREIAAGGI